VFFFVLIFTIAGLGIARKGANIHQEYLTSTLVEPTQQAKLDEISTLQAFALETALWSSTATPFPTQTLAHLETPTPYLVSSLEAKDDGSIYVPMESYVSKINIGENGEILDVSRIEVKLPFELYSPLPTQPSNTDYQAPSINGIYLNPSGDDYILTIRSFAEPMLVINSDSQFSPLTIYPDAGWAGNEGRFYEWDKAGRAFVFSMAMESLYYWAYYDSQPIMLAPPGSYPTGEDAIASISPNGQNVAYIIKSGFGVEPGIWIASTNGQERKVFVHGEGFSQVSWSPNGENLAFVDNYAFLNPNTTSRGVHVVNLNSKKITYLHLGDGRLITSVKWSPNNQSILVASGASPDYEKCGVKSIAVDEFSCLLGLSSIDLIRLEDGTVTYLTSGFAPIWSPSGHFILYQKVDSLLKTHTLIKMSVEKPEDSKEIIKLSPSGQIQKLVIQWVSSK
jgi:WD40 repeat protein